MKKMNRKRIMEALKSSKLINWKLNFHLFCIFIIFSLSIPNLVFANLSIFLNYPPNQTTTSDSTPDFNFTVSGTETNYFCGLFINDTNHGTNSSTLNNTPTIITANQSLSDGTYNWYINCSANSVTNQSETREITIDTAPVLTFKPPTEPNGTTVPRNWTEVNITIDESNLDTFDFDWDYTELDDYLVGYWRFDNNSAYGENNTHFYDYSGMGNNGTCSGTSCPNYTEGKKQLGLEFDGVDDYVSVPDSDSLDITDEITIETWIKLKNTGKNYIVDKFHEWGLKVSDYKQTVTFFITDQSPADLVTTETFSLNTWTHIVATYDGTNRRIYFNGVEVISDTPSGSIGTSAGSLFIGNYGSGGFSFNGTIDEVRIYNRALSADEIKQRYLSTRARYYDDSLVLAMNFNNNSAIGETSTKAVDISKYGNNGTIHGATWTTDGKFGSALYFDGSNEYVEVPDSDSLDITDKVTIEAWAKSAVANQKDCIIVGTQSPNTGTDRHYFGFDGDNGYSGIGVGAYPWSN